MTIMLSVSGFLKLYTHAFINAIHRDSVRFVHNEESFFITRIVKDIFGLKTAIFQKEIASAFQSV